ncbi:matrixin family metalloprotease [Naasia sp. SYSU D00948]|uniref:matrixin family metalloprotease n=1 Tax=Naasia sp. SYSU D00948 TaxID=2817379 RepID=UPI0027DCC296|nr:matrixin family metalloprotease [Naasia sp. SYSU D00948]
MVQTAPTDTDADRSSAGTLQYCALKPRSLPAQPPGMPAPRYEAIIQGRSQWVNGTVLHYHFLASAPGGAEQEQAVRDAFDEWKSVGIGLRFTEVAAASEAELRIGFVQGDGSWSYLGRDALQISQTERTMNFGWDLTSMQGRSTALHEIGHALGMPHEHQNPNAGIVWDEEAVYAYLGGPPNSWDREKVYQNVLRKLSPGEVTGSNWDPNSVMEYEFPGGLVISPEGYREGIYPPGTLSDLDRQFVRTWYPGGQAEELPLLEPFVSMPLDLQPTEQFDAAIRPDASREYSIGTFGESDVVLVLFEEVDGELRFLAGDDDSGEDRNALVKVKLFAGRRYVVRVRLYYAGASGRSAVMLW